MGVVYLAHQLVLDRMVALKLLVPELAEDEAFRARFLRESRIAASLDHPSIVPIFDAGEVDGRLYIAMRYIEGTDLGGLLDAEAPLDPARSVALLTPIADALDAAAEQGLVHRDVKPSNILLDAADRAYLADFGLTKETSELGLVESSHFAASVDYVAPEQIARQPIGPAADVYALGCVLYECLSGKAPFRARSQMSVLFAHLSDEIPEASTYNRDLPAAVDAVLVRALAKEPEERYPSARELVAAASEALGLSRTSSMRRRLFLLGGIGAAVMIGAAAAAIVLTRGSHSSGAAALDSLIQIDAGTGEVSRRIAVGHGLRSVATGGGAVWLSAAGDSSLWRVDPRTGTTRRVTGLTEPSDVAVDDAGGRTNVYVGNYLGVAQVGPSLSVTTSSVSGLGPTEWSAPTVASGRLGVWVGDSTMPAVHRLGIDPKQGATGVVKTIPVERGPNEAVAFNVISDIAVGDDAVWVTGDAFEHALFRIDPSVNGVRRFDLPSAPGPVAVGDGGVWVAGGLENVVWRIDSDSGEITATVTVPGAVSDIAVGAGAVWIASAVAGTVSRIDPWTARVERTTHVGGMPQGVAVGGGKVWVASRAT